MYHNPVLLKESINGLHISPSGIYIDLTFGGGGHTAEILNMLNKKGRVIAFDRDNDAIKNKPDDKRVTLIKSDFRFMLHFLRYLNAIPVEGIIADLGVSSYQIDNKERGFSTRYNAPLDMRMDRSQNMNAADIINSISEDKLYQTLKTYGELKGARKFAKKIIEHRNISPITNTYQLTEAVKDLIPQNRKHKTEAQLFQALRIAVNEEIDALKDMLMQTVTALKTGGRLVVISYHSIEDRVVKHFIRSGNFEDKVEEDFFGNTTSPFKPITKKAIQATKEEVKKNKRARSAKLRIAERI